MNSKIPQAPGQEMGICVLNLALNKIIVVVIILVLNKMIVS